MRAGIVGGGITGLACAWYLGQRGIDATVFDPAPGGTIGTSRVDGCLLESGPESWLASKPWAEDLIRELGMGDGLMGSNDAKRRTYILRQGRFITMPEGLQMMVPTKIGPVVSSPLFSWDTKIRMGLEMFRNPKSMPDRSVADFVRDHFNQEAVEYLAEPLLAGVFGGSPEELSAPSVLPKFVEYEQRFGSVVVGSVRAKSRSGGKTIFKTLRDGLGTLIDALVERVKVVRSPVEAIRPEWDVRAGGQWHAFDRLVLACGANRTAPLIRETDSRAADLLASIPYSGSSIWTFGYKREEIEHSLDAFGFLVPKSERRAIMACTWVQTKWQGRIPDDKAVFRCFSSDPDISREEMEADLRRLMGIDAEPVFAVRQSWPNSMPQYIVGHTARVREIDARMREIPGLWLAGNSFNGIGIPDCVRSGKRVAEEMAAL